MSTAATKRRHLMSCGKPGSPGHPPQTTDMPRDIPTKATAGNRPDLCDGSFAGPCTIAFAATLLARFGINSLGHTPRRARLDAILIN